MRFSISTYRVREAEQLLTGIAENATNIRPALEEIYLTILDIEAETFEKEGARGGFSRWAKLQLSTVVWKAKKKLSPAILEAEGTLMRAMTTYRSPDAYTKIEKDRIIFQPKSTGKAAHGLFHQGGTRQLPARPFVRFSQQDADAFGREIMRHLTRPRGGPGRVQVSFGG